MSKLNRHRDYSYSFDSPSKIRLLETKDMHNKLLHKNLINILKKKSSLVVNPRSISPGLTQSDKTLKREAKMITQLVNEDRIKQKLKAIRTKKVNISNGSLNL